MNGLSCTPQARCMQVDETDHFNCTGSNICVFYPIDRSLSLCRNKESNLTQIHITCVSLTNYKRYYIQKYLNSDNLPATPNITNEILNTTRPYDSSKTTLIQPTQIWINNKFNLTSIHDYEIVAGLFVAQNFFTILILIFLLIFKKKIQL